MPKLADKPTGATWTSPGREAQLPQASVSTHRSSAATARVASELSPGDAPLRVLHVINRLDIGGTEYGVLKIVNGLGDGEFEHRVCTTRGFDPGLARRQQLEDKVFVAGQDDAKFQFLLLRLARIMRAYKPHIVHSRNWGAIEAIPAARLARVPVVIHSEHGYEVEMLAGLPTRHRLLRRAVYGTADGLFAVTQELRSYHARQAWISPARIRVIYNGVDVRRFAPRPEMRLRLRQQLGLPAESFVVGTVGRLVPIKDYPTLLRAAEILIRRRRDVRVLLVGSGPERDQLERAVESSAELRQRALLLGPSENVAELLCAMDVFVLPSLSEGMSNTLLEAMASSLPVLATRVGGNPELVEEDCSGWLFRPGDVEDLADCLDRLADSGELRSRLGTAARQRAVTRFSLERMFDDYRQLYLELAGRRGIRRRA